MRRASRLRRRYGHARLTPDVLPYDGYGIMARDEYAAHLKALRLVRDWQKRRGTGYPGELPGDAAPFLSAEHRGTAAVKRAGLLYQDRELNWRVTPYAEEYLRQREGQ